MLLVAVVMCFLICCSCCFCLRQSVLRRRDSIQMEYDMLREELCRKKDEKDEVDVVFY